jgi:hypothetical protein
MAQHYSDDVQRAVAKQPSAEIRRGGRAAAAADGPTASAWTQESMDAGRGIKLKPPGPNAHSPQLAPNAHSQQAMDAGRGIKAKVLPCKQVWGREVK